MHGLALIDKPAGISSFSVVERVKRVLKASKVGHFGTLDPMATGLLLLGIGNATRLFDFYVNKRKRYTGIVKFGFSTNTFDAEGEPTSPVTDVDLNALQLEPVRRLFSGKIRQRTPIFSAKKLKGKPLYKYARSGVENLPTPENEIEIFQLGFRVLARDFLEITVSCSAGTYIRTIADDLGRELGCGGHLVALCRDRLGEFSLENACSLDAFESAATGNRLLDVIVPFEALLPELPKLEVDQEGKVLVGNGVALKLQNIIRVDKKSDHQYYRVFDTDGHFLAICSIDRNNQLFKPKLVFSY